MRSREMGGSWIRLFWRLAPPGGCRGVLRAAFRRDLLGCPVGAGAAAALGKSWRPPCPEKGDCFCWREGDAAGERGAAGSHRGYPGGGEYSSPTRVGWAEPGVPGAAAALEETQGLGVLRCLPGAGWRPPAEEGPAWRGGQQSHQQDAHGHEQRQSHVRGADCLMKAGRGRKKRGKKKFIRVKLHWEFPQDDTHRPRSRRGWGAVRSAEAPELGLPELGKDQEGEQRKRAGRGKSSIPLRLERLSQDSPREGPRVPCLTIPPDQFPGL